MNASITPSTSTEAMTRYCVQLVNRFGLVLQKHSTDDASEAMRAFFDMTRSKFGNEHGVGSYAALNDTQLELCAGWVAEGKGNYSTRFRTETGRQLFLRTEAAYNQAQQAATQES